MKTYPSDDIIKMRQDVIWADQILLVPRLLVSVLWLASVFASDKSYITINDTLVAYPCYNNITLTKFKERDCFANFTDYKFFDVKGRAIEWLECRNKTHPLGKYRLLVSWSSKSHFCDFVNTTEQVVILHHSKNTTIVNNSLLYRFNVMLGKMQNTTIYYLYFKTGSGKSKSRSRDTVASVTSLPSLSSTNLPSTSLSSLTVGTTTTYDNTTDSEKFMLIGFDKMGLFCFNPLIFAPLAWFALLICAACVFYTAIGTGTVKYDRALCQDCLERCEMECIERYKTECSEGCELKRRARCETECKARYRAEWKRLYGVYCDGNCHQAWM